MNHQTNAQKTPQNIQVDLKQRQVRLTWADGVQTGSIEAAAVLIPVAIPTFTSLDYVVVP